MGGMRSKYSKGKNATCQAKGGIEHRGHGMRPGSFAMGKMYVGTLPNMRAVESPTSATP